MKKDGPGASLLHSKSSQIIPFGLVANELFTREGMWSLKGCCQHTRSHARHYRAAFMSTSCQPKRSGAKQAAHAGGRAPATRPAASRYSGPRCMPSYTS